MFDHVESGGSALRPVAAADVDPGEAGLPAGLAGMEPGPRLAVLLSGIEVDGLSGHDRVMVMQAFQRMASHYQAQVYRSMASVADAVAETLDGVGLELVEDVSASEIRAALRLTRRAADAELDMARAYRTRLPQAWEAFSAGRIDRRRANLIVQRTDHLSTSVACSVAGQALERAADLTTGQLTALLRKLAVEADPDDALNRYETAVSERRVVLEPGLDGTASLHLLDAPPDRLARIRQKVDAVARSLRGDGETRTMDQLRADVMMDLLDSESPRRSARGAVVMTVDLETLAGLASHAGDLNGYGPVIADISRQVAEASHHAEWRFVATDGRGRPVQAGVTRRRPTAADQRLVETLYPTCVFPGCRIPASQCDLDHTTPWTDGGPSTVDNLAPLCRHDHRVRHQAGWSYRRTAEGDHQWTSPLGHRYTTSGRSP